jgi:hypothetical protein
MKISVWVVSTTIPERGEGPCLPSVFGSEANAEAYADKMLRGEWRAAAIADDDADDSMPYPGDFQSVPLLRSHSRRERHRCVAPCRSQRRWRLKDGSPRPA